MMYTIDKCMMSTIRSRSQEMLWCELPYTGFFYATKFSPIHELFWIREIKFVVAILKFLVNPCVRENLNANIQFLKKS